MEKPRGSLLHSSTSLLLLLVLLMTCSHICCQNSSSTPNDISTPYPLPYTTTTQTNAHPQGSNSQTWADTIGAALKTILGKMAETSGGRNATENLAELASKLPGIFQGLGTALKGDDVGQLLANLFADPRVRGIPAWIEAMLKGSNSSSLSQVMQSAAAQRLLQTFAQQSSSEQMQTMLSHVFSDVAKALQSLHISPNSSADDILSAILSDPSLMSSISSMGQMMLQNLTNQAGLQEMFQEALKNQLNVSVQCGEELGLLGQGLLNGELWALSMMDAMGKLPAGVLQGMAVLFGNFDQCFRVSETVEGNIIEGLFCGMAVQAPSAMAEMGAPAIGIHTCLPSSCDELDRYQLIKPLLQRIGSQYRGQYCYRGRDPSGDGRFIGVVVTFAILGALCAVGTLYGAYLDHQLEKIKKEEKALVKTSGSILSHVNQAFDSETNHKDSHVIHPNGNAGSINADITAKTSIEKESNIDGKEQSNGSLSHTSVVSVGDPAMHKANGDQSMPVFRESQPGTVFHGNQSASASQYHVNPSKPGDGMVSKILVGLSVLKNSSKVLSCAQNPSDITCLHGIRVLSITWVVLGHTFIMFGDAQGNRTVAKDMLQYFTYAVIPGALFAVDTFFLLSGCLTAFLFLKATKKSGLTLSGFILYYVHRIWRLTPLYAMMLAYYIGIFPYTKRGPFENTQGVDSETNCRKYWYINLLYVNNLVDIKKTCFGWSWYLSNDMQFAVVAPMILIPWVLKGKLRRAGQIAGWMLAVAFVVVHTVTSGVLSYTYDLSIYNFRDNASYMEKIYFKPWCRVGPYAVGLMLGYILHHTPRSYRMNKLAALIGWVVAWGGGFTLAYVNYDNLRDLDEELRWNAAQTAAYESLSKWLWSICVGWVIFACYTGYGGLVNSLLSWSAWVPLSRLTYGVYLIHLVVIYTLAGNHKTWIYLDAWTGTELFLAITVLSYLMSFIFSMLVEAPTLGLEKAVLGKIFKKKND